ncbi:FMN-binding glutamate synthase family protein [Marihabitans asiaticum]|uniref:Glutamate synthase (Ferredoxin) n=1 Tax=Marihabitans asiaticum TaxID=415218 RepID=A0A560WAN1_9MICO|nr:FMN-binding glutamate synthase family protein [Marihabitans asiaticum]TWD14687.1 glutamate synthase (ferredoxin) [Marihabitans asiaticum]
MSTSKILGAAAAALGGIALHDVLQREHTLKHNFPVVGNLRYLLERIGPELRQYIVTSNDEERPFSRDQRGWVYASSKLANNYTGFGTDNDIERDDAHVVIKHRTFSDVAPSSSLAHGAKGDHDDVVHLPAAKVMGAARERRHAFRPSSIVNVSGMSYGSLSGPAVESLNRGVALAGAYQNTGEGGLSPYHRNGGDLMFQVGTAYFGCRDKEGRFDLDQLVELVESAPVKAIEVKLSQGAKPGLGGMLPAAKISEQISQIRGIPMGEDCASPSRHTAFSDVDSMLDFVETIADATGLPVGIKSAVGDLSFWIELASQMGDGQRGVDFVAVDGGEGGTGAAPLIFTDNVALPFRMAFARVFGVFAEAGLTDDITFIGAGKLGLPDNAMVAMALGCDVIHVGREAMLAIGCIQAQKCHTDHCPTGVATQNDWLSRGLDPELKSVRLANYLNTLRRDLLKVSEAIGVWHPSLVTGEDIEIVSESRSGMSVREAFGYQQGWADLRPELEDEVIAMMKSMAEPEEDQPEPSVEE